MASHGREYELRARLCETRNQAEFEPEFERKRPQERLGVLDRWRDCFRRAKGCHSVRPEGTATPACDKENSARPASHSFHAVRARSHWSLWRSFLSRIFLRRSSSSGGRRSKVMLAGWNFFDSA